MITYNVNEVPTLRGEETRSAVVLTEAQLGTSLMNQPTTLLPKDATVEFLDKLIVKAQKRRETDTDDAPKNNFILMAVNGKQRWIGLGTFTRRRFDQEGNPYISPISADIPENISVSAFYDQFKNKKFRVLERISVETNVFEGNVRTDKKTHTQYPVLVYAN